MSRDFRSWKDDAGLRQAMLEALKDQGLQPRILHGRRSIRWRKVGRTILEALAQSGYMESMTGVPSIPPEQE